MKMSFRWYGESDPISLQYIRQIPNMKSIVSAVYDVKPGEVWPEESIEKMVKQCEENGLVFDVVVAQKDILHSSSVRILYKATLKLRKFLLAQVLCAGNSSCST